MTRARSSTESAGLTDRGGNSVDRLVRAETDEVRAGEPVNFEAQKARSYI